MAKLEQIALAFRALKEALGSNVTSVAVDGMVWTRQDEDSPHARLSAARDCISDLQTTVDMQAGEIERLLGELAKRN